MLKEEDGYGCLKCRFSDVKLHKFKKVFMFFITYFYFMYNLFLILGTDLIILFIFLYISGFVFKARMCETMHGLVPSFQAYVVPELQKVKTCSSESEVNAYLNPRMYGT